MLDHRDRTHTYTGSPAIIVAHIHFHGGSILYRCANKRQQKEDRARKIDTPKLKHCGNVSVDTINYTHCLSTQRLCPVYFQPPDDSFSVCLLILRAWMPFIYAFFSSYIIRTPLVPYDETPWAIETDGVHLNDYNFRFSILSIRIYLLQFFQFR